MLTLVGITAGVLTTACWIPQLMRSWRTRSTADISWPYLMALSAGIGLWVVYGAVSKDLAVLLANVATAAELGLLISFKVAFDRVRTPAVPPAAAGTE